MEACKPVTMTYAVMNNGNTLLKVKGEVQQLRLSSDLHMCPGNIGNTLSQSERWGPLAKVILRPPCVLCSICTSIDLNNYTVFKILGGLSIFYVYILHNIDMACIPWLFTVFTFPRCFHSVLHSRFIFLKSKFK